jgi:hypothetical protein
VETPGGLLPFPRGSPSPCDGRRFRYHLVTAGCSHQRIRRMDQAHQIFSSLEIARIRSDMLIGARFPDRREEEGASGCVSGKVGSRMFRSISESKNSCLSFTSTLMTWPEIRPGCCPFRRYTRRMYVSIGPPVMESHAFGEPVREIVLNFSSISSSHGGVRLNGGTPFPWWLHRRMGEVTDRVRIRENHRGSE